MRSRLAALAAVPALAVALAGCQLSLQGLPPPPGGELGGPTFHITAVFADVLNLPQHAKVKLDGATVGQVTTITAKDFRAYVGIDILRTAQLPPGTTAEIAFTTPLGEDYISLHRPASTTAGSMLGEGATLPPTSTSSAATIEDTLAALSLVLNGGGLDQLRTIVVEVNKALDGRGATVRDLVSRLGSLASALNARSGDIDRALAAMASLSTTLDQQGAVITSSLDSLAPALQVLAGETRDLSSLLVHLGKLSDAGTQVLDQSKSALLSDVRELAPILDALLSVKGQLGPALDDLARFESSASRAVPGDYLNLMVTLTAQFAGGGSSQAAAAHADAASQPGGDSGAATLLRGVLP